MHRLIAASCAFFSLFLTLPASAGMWFDIGSPDTAYVRANGDPGSWERYPPFPFGSYPPGSLVYEDVATVPCEALSSSEQICGTFKFIHGFKIYFNDGGCCGGRVILEKSTTLRFRYDPELVVGAGSTEEDLRLIFIDGQNPYWGVAEGAIVQSAADVIEAPWNGNVLGFREYAIVTQAVTPVAPTTWGRVKALYR